MSSTLVSTVLFMAFYMFFGLSMPAVMTHICFIVDIDFLGNTFIHESDTCFSHPPKMLPFPHLQVVPSRADRYIHTLSKCRKCTVNNPIWVTL